MAVQFKYTIKKGQRAPQVTLSAGTVIAGSDAMELNVDFTNITPRQAEDMLHHLWRQVTERPWPPM